MKVILLVTTKKLLSRYMPKYLQQKMKYFNFQMYEQSLRIFFDKRVAKKMQTIKESLEEDRQTSCYLKDRDSEEGIQTLQIDPSNLIYRKVCKNLMDNSKLIQDLQVQKDFKYELQSVMLELIGIMVTSEIIEWKDIKEDKIDF